MTTKYNKTLRRRVPAVYSHLQAKLEQRSGTWVLCTLCTWMLF